MVENAAFTEAKLELARKKIDTGAQYLATMSALEKLKQRLVAEIDSLRVTVDVTVQLYDTPYKNDILREMFRKQFLEDIDTKIKQTQTAFDGISFKDI